MTTMTTMTTFFKVGRGKQNLTKKKLQKFFNNFTKLN